MNGAGVSIQKYMVQCCFSKLSVWFLSYNWRILKNSYVPVPKNLKVILLTCHNAFRSVNIASHGEDASNEDFSSLVVFLGNPVNPDILIGFQPFAGDAIVGFNGAFLRN
jgi:hypothetical protein